MVLTWLRGGRGPPPPPPPPLGMGGWVGCLVGEGAEGPEGAVGPEGEVGPDGLVGDEGLDGEDGLDPPLGSSSGSKNPGYPCPTTLDRYSS